MDLTGRLNQVGIADLLQLIEGKGSTGELKIQNGLGHSARLYFEQGQILRILDREGNDSSTALLDIVDWQNDPESMFAFDTGGSAPPLSSPPSPAEALAQRFGSLGKVPQHPTSPPQGSPELQGSHWQVLRRVNGQSTLGELFAESDLPLQTFAEVFQTLLTSGIVELPDEAAAATEETGQNRQLPEQSAQRSPAKASGTDASEEASPTAEEPKDPAQTLAPHETSEVQLPDIGPVLEELVSFLDSALGHFSGALGPIVVQNFARLALASQHDEHPGLTSIEVHCDTESCGARITDLATLSSAVQEQPRMLAEALRNVLVDLKRRCGEIVAEYRLATWSEIFAERPVALRRLSLNVESSDGSRA